MDAVGLALSLLAIGFIFFGLSASEWVKDWRERRDFERFLSDLKARNE